MKDGNDAYNEFYASVSMLFRIASFLFLIAFLIFIVYSAFGSQEAFSYENLEYVVRNFALTLEENRDEDEYAIRYNPDSSRNFALIGNKFAFCGNSGITIYSSTGRQTCSDSFAFKNPIMVASDKYALIYDSGNCDLVIYNTFTKVHSTSLNKPIRGACMSQNGYYALITSSDEYNSTVEVYNDNFELINRFNKSGYIVDADMYDDRILITTVEGSADNANFNVQMLMYSFTEKKTLSTVGLTTSLPLSSKISESGFFLVCENEVIAYDINEEEKHVYSFNGNMLSAFHLSYDRAAVLTQAHGYDISFDYAVVDNRSSVLYDYEVNSAVYDIEFCGEWSCLLTDNGILVCGKDNERVISLDGVDPESRLLVCDSETLYLCTGSSAPVINIDE